MSEEKKARVNRFRSNDDKKRSVSAEMIARNAVSEFLSIPPEEIVFEVKPSGKPSVKSFDVEFNVSHSGDLVVCAVSDSPVGIDVEQIRPIDLKIAKRICNGEELYNLFGRIPTDADFSHSENFELLTRFFKLWTAKEASSKLTGNGLSEISKPLNNRIETVVYGEYVISIAY